MKRANVYIVVAIAVVVWAALLQWQGVTLKPSYLKPYSWAVAAAVVVFEAFDRWLWRVGPVPRLMGRPLVRGTWQGEFDSTWVDPATGARLGPRPAYLVIGQTYWSITARLLTSESQSRSLVGALSATRDQGATMQWTYVNEPRLRLQADSRIHHGAVMLDVHGCPPSRLTGCYWTDRDTKGELSFDGHSSRLHSDFAGAAADAAFSH